MYDEAARMISRLALVGVGAIVVGSAYGMKRIGESLYDYVVKDAERRSLEDNYKRVSRACDKLEKMLSEENFSPEQKEYMKSKVIEPIRNAKSELEELLKLKIKNSRDFNIKGALIKLIENERSPFMPDRAKTEKSPRNRELDIRLDKVFSRDNRNGLGISKNEMSKSEDTYASSIRYLEFVQESHSGVQQANALSVANELKLEGLKMKDVLVSVATYSEYMNIRTLDGRKDAFSLAKKFVKHGFDMKKIVDGAQEYSKFYHMVSSARNKENNFVQSIEDYAKHTIRNMNLDKKARFNTLEMM